MAPPLDNKTGATGITSVDALRIFPLGRWLLITGVVVFLALNGLGLYWIKSGLEQPLVTAAAPGTISTQLAPGDYTWVRVDTITPAPDSAPFEAAPADPNAATVTPLNNNAWLMIDQVSYDLLASMTVTADTPLTIEIRGDADQFPVALHRDQRTWLEHIAKRLAMLVVVPIALVVAGLVVGLRNSQRRNAALVAAMGEVP
ncbi:MAG: hypothetical protein DHS20C14_09530 [Phycisphaeraceae bacterium]|nr:MAG: hypothetical protein DHS20C14_09530 [Phycisphaeraceae bacterium]